MNTVTAINTKLIAVLIGGFLFSLLFWEEELALNLVLYTAFIVTSLLVSQPKLIQNNTWLIACLAHLLTCVEVTFNNIPFSILGYYATLFVMLALAHYQAFKAVVLAGMGVALQVFTAPFNLYNYLTMVRIGGKNIKPLIRPIKFMIIPIILLLVFGALYASANASFATYWESFFNTIEKVITHIVNTLFPELSLGYFLFFVFGLLFTAGLLLSMKTNPLEKLDEKSNENLQRARRKVKKPSFIKEIVSLFTDNFCAKKMILKTENTVGILCFAGLNILILSLNIAEISALFTYQNASTIHYANNLHDGTFTLIFSIVLAMLIILFFFNGNLNFYSKNKLLKTLAFIWIAQNALLILSVINQDFIYITAYGLTHKRIGVLIFSLLCILGLITVFSKVKNKKSFYYLVKTNGFAWFCLLIISGFIPWDQYILSFNIARKQQIPLDYAHAISLSNHTLIMLDKNRNILAEACKKQENIDAQKAVTQVNQDIDERIDWFMKNHQTLSFLSWNYNDWRTYHYFKDKNKAISQSINITK